MPAPVGGGGRPTARDQRRALCHRRAASAARHHHLHPRRDDGPEGGPIAARQWRTASEGARGDGAAVRQLSRGGRRKREAARAHPLPPRRSALRISARTGAARLRPVQLTSPPDRKSVVKGKEKSL